MEKSINSDSSDWNKDAPFAFLCTFPSRRNDNIRMKDANLRTMFHHLRFTGKESEVCTLFVDVLVSNKFE